MNWNEELDQLLGQGPQNTAVDPDTVAVGDVYYAVITTVKRKLKTFDFSVILTSVKVCNYNHEFDTARLEFDIKVRPTPDGYRQTIPFAFTKPRTKTDRIDFLNHKVTARKLANQLAARLLEIQQSIPGG